MGTRWGVTVRLPLTYLTGHVIDPYPAAVTFGR